MLQSVNLKVLNCGLLNRFYSGEFLSSVKQETRDHTAIEFTSPLGCRYRPPS